MLQIFCSSGENEWNWLACLISGWKVSGIVTQCQVRERGTREGEEGIGGSLNSLVLIKSLRNNSVLMGGQSLINTTSSST
jgi:hypothetical protein